VLNNFELLNLLGFSLDGFISQRGVAAAACILEGILSVI